MRAISGASDVEARRCALIRPATGGAALERRQELGEIERGRWDAVTSGVASRRSGQGIDRAEDRSGTTIAETCRHHRREARPVVAGPPHGLVGERRQSTLGVVDVAATDDRGTQPFDRVVEAIDDFGVA